MCPGTTYRLGLILGFVVLQIICSSGTNEESYLDEKPSEHQGGEAVIDSTEINHEEYIPHAKLEETNEEEIHTRQKIIHGDNSNGGNDDKFVANQDVNHVDSVVQNESPPNSQQKVPHSEPSDSAVESRTQLDIDKNTKEVVKGEGKEVSNQNDSTKTKEVLKNSSSASEDTIKEDGNQSFFSLGNILRNLVDPVLEEFEKADNDKKIVEISNSSNPVNSSLLEANVTIAALPIENQNKTDKKGKFTCVGKNFTLENITSENVTVKIVNSTQLLSALSFEKNKSNGDCVLVMFFVPYCNFCAKTAPNYNALARVFPQLEIIAVDAAQFSNLNAKFGTVSVPNILLFHQSRAVVRFNHTQKTFENLVSFVKNATGFEPNSTVSVTEEDYIGPLKSVAEETTDYILLLAWVFVLVCSSVMFVKSHVGQQWINRVKILWQEHQHID